MAVTASAKTVFEVSYQTTNDHTVASAKETKNTKTDSTTDYASGSGSQQVNRIYSARRSLTASSGTDDLNLSALTDTIFGSTINFDKIRFIYIKNREPSGGANLLIGGAGSGAWVGPFNGSTTEKLKLAPTDEWMQTNKLTGWDVPTSNSVLRITHDGASSGALDYDIIIGGTV